LHGTSPKNNIKHLAQPVYLKQIFTKATKTFILPMAKKDLPNVTEDTIITLHIMCSPVFTTQFIDLFPLA